MKTFTVDLVSEASATFRCQKAANSLDIDTSKKLKHHLEVSADLETDFNIGLIIGASGSGKTTLAKQIFGDDCFKELLDPKKPIIDQLPEDMTYDECAALLNGVGLTSVPCWIRPVATLSNGQKSRAEAALILASEQKAVIDEWTSVVDRTVAKAMSACIQKAARRHNKQIILLSCHYDVVEWLNPDWIIDCNKQEYTDRRLLWRDYQRQEKLHFEIREADKRSWAMFSKYHYLSEKLASGFGKYYGLFHNGEQIGFQAFSNYVPWRDKTKPRQMHSNRVVIHPDYVGLGLGIIFVNETARMMKEQGYDVRAKFSSTPMYRARCKYPELWRLMEIKRQVGKTKTGGKMERKGGFREKVKTYSFKYIG